MSLVKVCGNTSPADIDIAYRAGADYAGIIAHPEYERGHTVNTGTAAMLMEGVRGLGSSFKGVLLPRAETAPEILRMISAVEPDLVQIGTVESPELIERLKDREPELPVIQVVHVGGPEALETAGVLAGLADMILFDSPGDRPGGNGITHDWSITARAVKVVSEAGKKSILAGGLGPRNVAGAIEAVKPAGVDVESGVKGADDVNDTGLTTDFLRSAHLGFLRLRIADTNGRVPLAPEEDVS